MYRETTNTLLYRNTVILVKLRSVLSVLSVAFFNFLVRSASFIDSTASF